MKSTARIILAMAPGKREFGVAVFEGNKLIYFAVRTVSRGRSAASQKEEIGELLSDLFAFFKPQCVVLKAVSKYQRASVVLTEIVELIKCRIEAKQVPVIEISLEQIKSFAESSEKQTQKNTFQMLVNLYPELRQFFSRPNKWQNDYYHNLFSAVAVGVTHLKSHMKK